jgi:hypothetical protein
MPVKRVHELMAWVQSGEYDRIAGGDYPSRHDAPRPPREEAADAATHYAERFKETFKDAGESIEDAGKKLAEWLKRSG